MAGMTISFLVAIYFAWVHRALGFAPLPPWEQLVIGVAVTTVGWLGVTFVTPPAPTATLQRFYDKIRPMGKGWRRVVDTRAFATNDGSITAAFLAWFLGVRARLRGAVRDGVPAVWAECGGHGLAWNFRGCGNLGSSGYCPGSDSRIEWSHGPKLAGDRPRPGQPDRGTHRLQRSACPSHRHRPRHSHRIPRRGRVNGSIGQRHRPLRAPGVPPRPPDRGGRAGRLVELCQGRRARPAGPWHRPASRRNRDRDRRCADRIRVVVLIGAGGSPPRLPS